MALDDTNKVQAGGRVLIETEITDAKTGVAPVPLPDVVTCNIYPPDGAVVPVVMASDGGGNYSVSYQVPDDAPEGAYKTQIAMVWADFSDIATKQTSFWVSNE